MGANQKNSSGCLVVIVLLLAAGLVYSLIRYFQDSSLYKAGMAAYSTGDLDAAYGNFDSIQEAFHIIDLGKLRQYSEIGTSNCAVKEYDAAYFQFEKGRYREAYDGFHLLMKRQMLYEIGEYYQLASEYRENSLSKIIEQTSDQYVAGNCDQVIDNVDWINMPDRSSRQSIEGIDTEDLKNNCLDYNQQVENVQGSAWQKTKSMADFVLSHEGDSLAELASQRIILMAETQGIANVASAEACDIIFREWIDGPYEDYLFACGTAFADAGWADSAVDLFNQFIEKYPDDGRYQDVVNRLADLLIQNARAEGAGVLPPPEVTGRTSKGTTQYLVTNDTPYELRFVFSGPEKKIFSVPACAECIEYAIAPFSCPSNRPEETVVLTPGNYSLLVETVTSEGVTPYTGDFTLEGGSKYEYCFFIVTRVY